MLKKYEEIIFRQREQHVQKHRHTENMAYLNFSHMTLVQREATQKRMLDEASHQKGFKKENIYHRNQSLVFLLVWHITENDDAKQKC